MAERGGGRMLACTGGPHVPEADGALARPASYRRCYRFGFAAS